MSHKRGWEGQERDRGRGGGERRTGGNEKNSKKKKKRHDKSSTVKESENGKREQLQF